MTNIAWRDILFFYILTFLLMVMFMMSKIHEQADHKASADPPGNVIVHIVWPQGDTDVDLWVNGPGEPVPVGYSNKGGVLWNLLRDDLGWPIPGASSQFHYEDAYTRGVLPGEYTVNVHCFRCPQLPVPVDVEISMRSNTATSGKSDDLNVIATSRVELRTDGQERTALNFRIKDDLTVDPASMNAVFKPLRELGAAKPN